MFVSCLWVYIFVALNPFGHGLINGHEHGKWSNMPGVCWRGGGGGEGRC